MSNGFPRLDESGQRQMRRWGCMTGDRLVCAGPPKAGNGWVLQHRDAMRSAWRCSNPASRSPRTRRNTTPQMAWLASSTAPRASDLRRGRGRAHAAGGAPDRSCPSPRSALPRRRRAAPRSARLGCRPHSTSRCLRYPLFLAWRPWLPDTNVHWLLAW